MHYYTHNVGEFALETQGLSLAHIGAYMRLVDRYVSTEKPIKTQWVSLAFDSESARIANEVLEAFFEPADGARSGWIHPRFAQEIAAYQARSEVNKANGKRGGRPKKAKETDSVSSGFYSGSEEEAKKSLTNNHKPITNNQEPDREESANALPAQASAPASTPVRKRKSSSISSVEKPDDIDAQVWSDWLQIRKAKRLPLTKTAWDAMCTEAEKVGFTPAEAVKYAVERGWASFKAPWVINEEEEQKSKRSSSKTNELQEQFNNNPAYMEANGDWSFTE